MIVWFPSALYRSYSLVKLISKHQLIFFSPLHQPSEFNTYYDIEAVYNCLKNEYGIKQEDLILYGQSVGSGPTLHLASRLHKLRGVVLHSAILSGIRVLYPVKMTFWFDIFKVSFDQAGFLISCLFLYYLFSVSFVLKFSFSYFQNIDKIPKVNCPVLVIHVSIFSFNHIYEYAAWFRACWCFSFHFFFSFFFPSIF